MSAEIQHEITRSLSMNGGYYFNNGGYFRNTDSMQRATDNERVSPADFDQFCVTAPSDPRLPNGGGYQICGLSAIKPSAFGLSQPVVKATSNFGKDIRRNHFFGVGLNARLAERHPPGRRLRRGPVDEGSVLRRRLGRARQLHAGALFGRLQPRELRSSTRRRRSTASRSARSSRRSRRLAMVKLNGSVPIPVRVHGQRASIRTCRDR